MAYQCLSPLIYFLMLWQIANTEKIPDDFKKCAKKDSTCLKDAIQDALLKLKDGLPELDVPPLDPLYLGEFTIGSTQVVGVEQKYTNAELDGLSTSEIHNFIFDLDKGKIGLNFTAPVVHLNASYDANGKILVLPFYGHGQLSLSLVGFHGDIQFDIEAHTRNSKKYPRVTKYSFEIVLDRLIFNMENLFDGNALLSENLIKTLNENWEVIYKEVISDYARVYGGRLTELMNKLFDKVAISEMFLD